MTDHPDRVETVEQLWSIDGPHTGDSVVAAARAAQHLCRYLAHATHPAHRQTPPVVYSTTGALAAGMPSLQQALGQLAVTLEQHTLSDELRHSEGGDPVYAALTASVELEDARHALDPVARALGQAQAATVTLYLNS